MWDSAKARAHRIQNRLSASQRRTYLRRYFFLDIPQNYRSSFKEYRRVVYSLLLGIASAMSATQLLNPKAESRVCLHPALKIRITQLTLFSGGVKL